MVKAAFFHDSRLYQDKSGQVLSLNYPYSLWERYLRHFDALVVSTRMRSIDEVAENVKKGLSISGGERVTFRPITTKRGGILADWLDISLQISNIIAHVDCVIVRLPSFIGFLASHLVMRSGKPWAAEVVGCSWDSLFNYGNVQGKIAALPSLIIQKHYVKKAPFSLYVSQNFLQQRYPCNGFIGACSDVSIASVEDRILQRRLERIDDGFKERPINFGLIGSLDVGYKGHETAIRALAMIHDQIPDFRLRFLGSGNPNRWHKFAERKGVGDKVQFDGIKHSGQQVYEWLDNIDVYTIPSLQEGLPRALVEAMSRGCPAVGVATGGITELLDASFLVPRRDFRSLANVMKKLVANGKQMKEQAQRNFSKAKEFEYDALHDKRNIFWSKFAAYVKSNCS